MKLSNLLFLVAIALLSPIISADTKGPHITTVDDIRNLQPGPHWDPNRDNVLVQVRGFLRSGPNMYLYATKDQAQLDDMSGVLVSDEGDGDLQRDCSEGFVDLIARLAWMEHEMKPILIPTVAKKLTLRERRSAEEVLCWKAE